MGLTQEYFWSLTWYEWGFEILKLYEKVKQKSDDWEAYLAVKRIEIADFKNYAFRTESGQPLGLTGEDIFKLSFDKKTIVEERPATFAEVKQLLGSRFKRDGSK